MSERESFSKTGAKGIGLIETDARETSCRQESKTDLQNYTHKCTLDNICATLHSKQQNMETTEIVFLKKKTHPYQSIQTKWYTHFVKLRFDDLMD